jgi:hypothetical protein
MEPPMTWIVCSQSLTRAVVAAATLTTLASAARADAIDFQALGSQQVPSLDVGGVTITGSNFVVVYPNSGLTIRGGLPGIGIGGPDHTIDPTESVTFRFDGGPATNIMLSHLFAGGFGNTPTSAQGESLITAFGPGGNSLGTVDLVPVLFTPLSINISAAFGNQPISTFTLEPKGDSVNGSDITLSGLAFTTVPEPLSIFCWSAVALALLGLTSKSRGTRAKARPNDASSAQVALPDCRASANEIHGSVWTRIARRGSGARARETDRIGGGARLQRGSLPCQAAP